MNEPELIMPFGPYSGWDIEEVPDSHLLRVYENIECFGKLKKYLNENIDAIRKNAAEEIINNGGLDTEFDLI